MINNNNRTFTAFLTKTGILRKSSVQISCVNRSIDININNFYLIRATHDSISVVPFPTDAYELKSHQNKFIQISYQHDKKFIEEIAFLDHPENTLSNLVNGHIYTSVNDLYSEKKPYTHLNWLNLQFGSFSDLVVKVTLSILICMLICCTCGIVSYILKRRRSKNNVHNWIELQRRPSTIPQSNS